jgi:hypothetical protein
MRLEGWPQYTDARPSFEARNKVRAPQGRTLRVRPGMTSEIASRTLKMTLRFAEITRLIFPVGQITRCCVQHHLQKYFCFLREQITCLIFASCPERGALAIVTDVGRDAVDADALLTNSA